MSLVRAVRTGFFSPNMSVEPFLAYKRSGDLVEREAAYSPDFADDIDERNGWQELGAKPTALQDAHEELVKVSARGLAGLLSYCFDNVKLGPDGRGLQVAIRRFCAVAHSIQPTLLRLPPVEP